MNSAQVADLGLHFGDEIFLKSAKGWSGFYQITDSGCAYGTVDIYIDYKDLPTWGVEYGAEILIEDGIALEGAPQEESSAPQTA